MGDQRSMGARSQTLPAKASNYLPYFILCSHYFHAAERPLWSRLLLVEPGKNGKKKNLFCDWKKWDWSPSLIRVGGNLDENSFSEY